MTHFDEVGRHLEWSESEFSHCLSQQPSCGLIIVLSLFLFWSITLAPGAAPQDPLWLKGLAVARTNSDLVAGLVVTRSEVVYKGETNGVHELWERSSLGPHGEVITQTVKVLEDGKDVTAKETKNQKGKAKKSSNQGSGNPFDAEMQDHLFLVVTNQTRNISGNNCIGYLFEVRNTNGPKTRGIAWVEKETGVPREIENMTVDPLPDKHLKQVAITTRYETTTNGWHVKEMLTTGRISTLFITVEFHTLATFSEYWKRPARKERTGTDEE